MPGRSYSGPLPQVDPARAALTVELRTDVEALATDIGIRDLEDGGSLRRAETRVHDALTAAGYDVRREDYDVAGHEAANLIAERRGTTLPDEIVLVGAHYDSVSPSPGADDNASGTAALLALARRFAPMRTPRTVRFVAFTNEEPPRFWTPSMGSRVDAARARRRGDHIVAMLSLESIAYYTTRADTQHYPVGLGLFYPSRGDFIGLVGFEDQLGFVRDLVGRFRAHARMPSEGAAEPGFVPGVGWSDHWSFHEEGYPALMITDTAPFRNPHYHQSSDTPETLDYRRFAEAVVAIRALVSDLANRGP